MKKIDYFLNLDDKILAIQPNQLTYYILGQIKESIVANESEEVFFYTQIIKNPKYNGLAVESLIATQNSISDIIIGTDSLSFTTVLFSKIKNIQLEIIPFKSDNTSNYPFTVRLLIYYGETSQALNYTAPGEKLNELIQLKKQLIKLINQ